MLSVVLSQYSFRLILLMIYSFSALVNLTFANKVMNY